MTVLAAALSAAMTSASTSVAVLDPEGPQWSHHPWPEVHARAENVAERIGADGATRVGLIGEPTVEFIAAISGTFFAGAGLSVLPGPIRRADPDQWARGTMARLGSLGVTAVFSQSRATMTAAPNMAFNLIGKFARSLEGYDLSNLGFTLNGGEPVDCLGYQRFADRGAAGRGSHQRKYAHLRRLGLSRRRDAAGPVVA